ncbi:MAG: hypothetical protein WC374_00390 [Phycisphaerae bacterium]|jgi:hypothetical protein
MSLSDIKRFAGSIKYRAVDCWPYFMRVKKAKQAREQMRAALDELTPVNSSVNGEPEIHMLCGRRHIDMGIWASWSIMRFLDSASLYVHSDGTLEESDMRQWRRIVPDVVLVERGQADKKVEEEIKPRWPTVSSWRSSYRTSPQLVDVQLFGRAEHVLQMDSDIICFSEPTDIKSLLSVKGEIMRWHGDARTCYIAEPERLSEIIGAQMPLKFNCGFLYTNRLGQRHFDIIEASLQKIKQDGKIELSRYWATQTMYAVVAAFCNDAESLPGTYTVRTGPVKSETVICHYPGTPKVRPLYFLEGVQRLIDENKLRNKS